MSGTSRTRRRRIGAAASTAVALVALTSACDPEPPPPPPPVFTVTSTADLPDADPGDGICEATPGQGDCTVRAGVEEGNALGSADLVLPAGDYVAQAHYDPELDWDHIWQITGSIRITGAGTPTTTIRGGPLEEGARMVVANGGSLTVEDVRLHGIITYVDGDFALLRSQMGGYDPDDATLMVSWRGRAVVQSSWVIEPLWGDAVDNAGTTLFDNATVSGLNGEENEDGGIRTQTGGTTYLRGTWIGAPGGCGGTGVVVSMGYNAAPDDACGLDQPTDQTDAPAVHYDYDGAWWAPPSGGLVDAIPVGEAGCGVIQGDVYGTTRAVDGDRDGVAACDIGAEELVPPVPM